MGTEKTERGRKGYFSSSSPASTPDQPNPTRQRNNSKKVKRLPNKGPNEIPSTESLGGEYGWIVRGDHEPVETRVPFTKPTIKQV